MKNKSKSHHKPNKADLIAKGASVIAATAGAIAVGALLSQKENRHKIARTLKISTSRIQQMAIDLGNNAQQAYPAIQQRISKPIKKSSRRQKK